MAWGATFATQNHNAIIELYMLNGNLKTLLLHTKSCIIVCVCGEFKWANAKKM